MKIAIDLDMVLVDIQVIKGVIEDWKLPMKRSDVKTWGMTELPERARKEVYRRFKMRKYMVDRARPIRGVKKKLKEWAAAGHQLACLTSRDSKIAISTIDFVNRQFPQITETLVLNGTKKDALVKGKFDVLIDDSLKYANEALAVGAKAILISNKETPYNWERMSDDLPVFRSLASVDLSVVKW